MSFESRVEIHYYSQYQAAVAMGENLRAVENINQSLIFFCSYSLRQLNNLGQIGSAAARVLTKVGSNPDSINYYLQLIQGCDSIEELVLYAPLLGTLGVELSQVVQFSVVPDLALARASSGGDTSSIANELWPDVIRIVDKRQHDGKHQFLCDIKIDSDKALLNLKPKGFGIFGKAVNWYATTSIMVLYKFLLEQENASPEFQRALVKCANHCGSAILAGDVSRINLLSLPISIANSAID